MTSIAWPELQMVGRSDAIGEIDTEVACAARSNASVLITGEAGSGKAWIARLIHQRSIRAAAPFVTVNCAGVPDDELESELAGLLDLAPGGTVLLEGVADMSSRIQDLLFNWPGTAALQRTGGNMPQQPTDVRLMTATSRDLHADVVAREFREDLYYRLNVIHVSVPPLRNRVTDVSPLVDHFLDSHAAEHGGARLQVTAAVMDALVAHSWPGNVRELKSIIEHIARAAKGPMVGIGDLPVGVLPAGAPAPVAPGERT